MKEVTFIFPHQLFKDHPGLARKREVYIVEDQLFFADCRYPMRFHKKKLVLHRASMKAYQEDLAGRGFTVHYREHEKGTDMAYLFDPLKRNGVGTISMVEPVDFILEKRVRKGAGAGGIKVVELSTSHNRDNPLKSSTGFESKHIPASSNRTQGDQVFTLYITNESRVPKKHGTLEVHTCSCLRWGWMDRHRLRKC